MNHHTVLGVTANATLEEIRKAYRKLAKEHHPDRGGDVEHFKKINEAYDYLKNARKHGNTGARDQDFDFRNSSPNMHTFHDMFEQFFNPSHRPVKNKDIKIVVSISLEDVALGREIVGSYAMPSGRTETSTFKIPTGVETGDVIQFKGLGDDSHEELTRGDLLVHVKVMPHDKFERDGVDLLVKERVSVFDLMLGTNIVIENLTGSTISVIIKKGTSPDAILRVPQHGLPDKRTGEVGDLFIKLKVHIPKISDPAILRKIKEISNEISISAG